MRDVILGLAPVSEGDVDVGKDASVDFVKDIDGFIKNGISMIRLRVTDSEGKYSSDFDRFSQLAVWVRERADIVIELPTEGGVDVTPNQRVDPLLLNPDVVSIMPGSVNCGSDVLYNPLGYVEFLIKYCSSSDLKPMFRVVSGGMIRRVAVLSHHIPEIYPPVVFNLVFGGDDFLPANYGSLLFLKEMLPPESVWFASVKGELSSAFVLMVVSLGGNLIIGREYNNSFDGKVVNSNMELVERVVRLLNSAGYGIASVQRVRDLISM